MDYRSPNRNQVLADARKLYEAGELTQARELLFVNRGKLGTDSVIDAELRRLFPAPAELLSRLKEYRDRLKSGDAKERQRVTSKIARFVRGTVSRSIMEFVRHTETMTFFIEFMADPDPSVQEDMTVAVARTLDSYMHFAPAEEPLIEMLDRGSNVAKMWAIEGLAAATDGFLPYALKLLDSKDRLVRKAVYRAIGFGLMGGGIRDRPPMGQSLRELLRERMLSFDPKLPAEERIARASWLAATAKPQDLSVLQEWQRKDGSKFVKSQLQSGIDRIIQDESGQ
jgi:hypothetical protein